MPDNHLIIFVKNPIAGQVKTRIAATVGHAQAVQIYRQLLAHTQAVVGQVAAQPVVYYGDFINPDDGWNACQKQLQTGSDLGERMLAAFQQEFAAGASRVVIIGSDCLAITPGHIDQAFAALSGTDVVIGPATDGGYYLLGMTQPHAFVFADMPWSQPELGQLTEQVIQQHALTVTKLAPLTDIDTWDDYLAAGIGIGEALE